MMSRAYRRLLVRRGIVALSAGVTLFAAVSLITSAAIDAPVAEDLSFADGIHRSTPYRGGSAAIELSADGGDGELTYEIVDAPNADGEPIGDASVDGDHVQLSIDRDAPSGPARFTYAVVDQDGTRSDDATVSFDVANRTPLTRDLTLTTTRDAPLDIWPYARDAEDGGPFAWRSPGNRITYSDPVHGTIEPFFGAGGSDPEFAEIDHKVVYVPDPGYIGADRFTYTFTDADGGASSSTVSVDVVDAGEPKRGSVAGVRYRCALHVKTDERGRTDPDGKYDARETSRVSRYLGGDLVLEVAARVDVPARLEPGETYTPADPRVRLRPQPGLAELLAGAPAGDADRDLEDVGFGQSSVGAELSMSAGVARTASGRSREIPVDGLTAKPVSARSDGIELGFAGSMPRLTAPPSGAVVVSLPQVFLVDLALHPGLLGRDGSIGLRCYAAQGADLQVARIPVSGGAGFLAD
ncbi:Ig-like domain-containing protein [Solicola gregarius]|uniref:Ig-like domain-containing protein n=1 Tax=Solicola gregarius TaxID=2908642 RepID=A0AA46TDZ3_9ACTN|nr:Ig-like domain-containing protein [Solicola gregarius]UYM03335.1 Ig-like domain-containing protein [Solicola gregarius]